LGPSGFSKYLWDNGSTDSNRAIKDSGIYWVISTTSDCDQIRIDTFIVSSISTPQINVNGFDLGTTTSYNTYQWMLNGKIIPHATDSIYTVTENGNYQVIVSNGSGCKDTSAIYEVTNVSSIRSMQSIARQIKIYPNPVSGIINISAPVEVSLSVCSIEGKTLKYIKKVTQVSLQDLAEGIYFLQLYDLDNRLIKTEKIIKIP